MSLLQIEQLVAGWLGPITQPVSFHLERGEILGLVGPNGAGKSTLLAAIAGTGRVFSGAVRLEAGAKLNFQSQVMPPIDGLPLTGAELLAVTGAGVAGLPSWLSDCLGQRLDRLSGGQRQYLALWAVLQAPADLLLLDEPSNNLDEAGLAHLETALARRARQGAGIVLVSHDGDLISSCCQRVLRLEAGHG